MTTELATSNGQTGLQVFDREQLDLLKRTICLGATDDEFKLFLNICGHTGLDPFSRQIYLIPRRTKVGDEWKTVRQALVSIDGMRLQAERSGKYAGQVGPFWCGPDGVWQEVWLSKDPPAAAKVGILRTDFKEPIWGIARYESYVQLGRDGKPSGQWPTMADVMTAKCAESLGIRRAFPRELSGLYSREEMEQADNPPRPIQATISAPAPLQHTTTAAHSVDGEVMRPPRPARSVSSTSSEEPKQERPDPLTADRAARERLTNALQAQLISAAAVGYEVEEFNPADLSNQELAGATNLLTRRLAEFKAGIAAGGGAEPTDEEAMA